MGGDVFEQGQSNIGKLALFLGIQAHLFKLLRRICQFVGASHTRGWSYIDVEFLDLDSFAEDVEVLHEVGELPHVP